MNTSVLADVFTAAQTCSENKALSYVHEYALDHFTRALVTKGFFSV